MCFTLVFLVCAALVDLEDDLTHKVEEEEDTDDPGQPPWRLRLPKLHTDEDVRD